MPGFLERVIKQGVRKGVRQGVGNALGNAISGAVGGALNNAIGGAQPQQGGYTQNAPSYQPQAAVCPSCGNRVEGSPKFCPSCGTPITRGAAVCNTRAAVRCAGVDMRNGLEALLAQELPGYTVRRGIPADGLGWLPAGTRCKPYDYCIYGMGGMKGVIMVTDHNRDNNAAFLNAKRACMSAGVPFINFYTHMPNERNYVVNRIKQMLLA